MCVCVGGDWMGGGVGWGQIVVRRSYITDAVSQSSLTQPLTHSFSRVPLGIWRQTDRRPRGMMTVKTPIQGCSVRVREKYTNFFLDKLLIRPPSL